MLPAFFMVPVFTLPPEASGCADSITVSLVPAAAPEAFLGLLKGKNFGKQLVKLHG